MVHWGKVSREWVCSVGNDGSLIAERVNDQWKIKGCSVGKGEEFCIVQSGMVICCFVRNLDCSAGNDGLRSGEWWVVHLGMVDCSMGNGEWFRGECCLVRCGTGKWVYKFVYTKAFFTFDLFSYQLFDLKSHCR